jgi:hypothetical protein
VIDNKQKIWTTVATFHPQEQLSTRHFSPANIQHCTNFSPPHKFSLAKTPYTRENTGGKFKKTGERQQL